jgi:fluoroquinolone resistance protein
MEYIEDRRYENVNFQSEPLIKGEYDNCDFVSCEFSGTDLSEINFNECRFIDCNLSLCRLKGTAFRDILFQGSKMLGLHFENCNDFGFSFSFDRCQLNSSSFYRKKLKRTMFKDSNLQEVDFSECDLTGAVFDNCNLQNAVFDNTIIEKTDFRTSYNYTIDPERNRIRGAKFSFPCVSGLLAKYDIEIESNN